MSINKKSRKRRQQERATAAAENKARCLEALDEKDRYINQAMDWLEQQGQPKVVDPHAGEGFIRRTLRQLFGRPSGRM